MKSKSISQHPTDFIRSFLLLLLRTLLLRSLGELLSLSLSSSLAKDIVKALTGYSHGNNNKTLGQELRSCNKKNKSKSQP